MQKQVKCYGKVGGSPVFQYSTASGKLAAKSSGGVFLWIPSEKKILHSILGM